MQRNRFRIPAHGSPQSAQLDRKLRCLEKAMAEGARHPEVTVTCFCPDEKKAGGACFTISRQVKKTDVVQRQPVLIDGEEKGIAAQSEMAVSFDNIREMGGPLFEKMDEEDAP